LTLTLPSDRAINYPGAHLIPNSKFEDGDPDIEFFDNARGQWKPVRAWFGTLVENVVQGTARDLLAAALLRFEARGLPVVFHCHDEVVVEVPKGSVSEQHVLAILLEPPAWATGLPLGPIFNLLRLKKNLAGDSQSAIVHCRPCWPSQRWRRLPPYRKCPPVQHLTRAHRFCRRADIEVVPVKSACAVSHEDTYLGQ
jgi:hypothetical protein